MSRQSPTPDSWLEWHIRQEAQWPAPSRGASTIPVERPFTASQARIQWVSSQDPPNITTLPEENVLEHLELPDIPPRSPPEPPWDPQAEILNLELSTALLALAQQIVLRLQKRHRGIREPDTFSGGSANDLQAFIFQCQIYFHACEGKFKEDSKKIYFTISYLRSITLDYFKPFIN